MSSALPPHLDPRGRHRGRGVHSNPARPVGRVLGALLSTALLGLSGYYWLTFRDINTGLHRLSGVVVNQNPTNTKKDLDGKDQNILLVGNDDRTNMTDKEISDLHVGRDGGSLATDTMMILHVPADGKRATLISLPRDSFVKIPGYRDNKLNSAYANAYVDTRGPLKDKQTAGANLLIKTITDLTGLTINHYIQVDLLGFYRISNAIKGVPINLCHAVDDTGAHNQATGVGGGSGLKLSAGKHTISGAEALAFVRQRHNFPDGREDLDRVKRQQYFLTAAFRQVASVGILFQLNALGDAVKKSITFDPILDILTLARQLENLTANNIVGRTIPTTLGSDGSLQVDPPTVQAFVDKVVGPASPSSSSPAGRKSTGTSRTTPAPTKTATPIDSTCIN
ncbi:MAG: Transcriptional attenuator, LytR family [Jatrophihabitans sp.]|nr:Transcriptional attenuator, LytR family [Jatrophihabitans sp.]